MAKTKRKRRKPPYWTYSITLDAHYTGQVQAYTKSEARALVKRECGIKSGGRLPVGIRFTKVEVKDAA